MKETFIKLFDRELSQLKLEIESYSNEENLWLVSGEIINSGGNLVWHLVGNLNHFIGTIVGGTDYVRDRPLEFSIKNVPKATLIESVESLNVLIHNTLSKMDDSVWKQEFPHQVFGSPMTYEYFFVHLLGHLNYHMGQLNYHRRLLEK